MRQRLRLRLEENNLWNSMSCVGNGRQSVFNVFSRGVLNIGLLLETRACRKRKRKIQSWQSIGIKNKEKKNIDEATPSTRMLIPCLLLSIWKGGYCTWGPFLAPRTTQPNVCNCPRRPCVGGGLPELEAMPPVLC